MPSDVKLKKDIPNLSQGRLVSRYISYIDKENGLLKSDKDISDDKKLKS